MPVFSTPSSTSPSPFHTAMSSTVCQGLQSCLEPRLVQQRALCLRLVSPKPHLFKRAEPHTSTVSEPCDKKPQTPTRTCNTNEADRGDFGTFSSITSLVDAPQEGNYIHPLSRRPRSKLSEKSLELCTENLGCETGTGIVKTNCCFSSSNSSDSSENEPRKEKRKGRSVQGGFQKKNIMSRGAFPPPLTSIAGGSCIHVTPHREDGRLVIKAVTASYTRPYFQVQRTEGRLLLRSLNKNTTPYIKETEEEEEEEEEEDCEEENDNEAEKEAAEESKNVEGVNGNKNNGEIEMGMGKIQRPGRCSEGENGNKGVIVWEPFWVASS